MLGLTLALYAAELEEPCFRSQRIFSQPLRSESKMCWFHMGLDILKNFLELLHLGRLGHERIRGKPQWSIVSGEFLDVFLNSSRESFLLA